MTDVDALADYALGNAAEFVADMDDAEARFVAGERGRPLAEVIADLDGEDQ